MGSFAKNRTKSENSKRAKTHLFLAARRAADLRRILIGLKAIRLIRALIYVRVVDDRKSLSSKNKKHIGKPPRRSCICYNIHFRRVISGPRSRCTVHSVFTLGRVHIHAYPIVYEGTSRKNAWSVDQLGNIRLLPTPTEITVHTTVRERNPDSSIRTTGV